MDINTETALEVFARIIKNENINRTENNELYRDVAFNEYVRRDLERVAEIFEMKLMVIEDVGIFLAPLPNNKVFGFTNEELRTQLKVKDNKQLYLAYFTIYIVMAAFYINTTYRADVQFITGVSIKERVSKRLDVIADTDMESNDELAFKNIRATWESLADFNCKDKEIADLTEKGSKTKIGLVNKVLDFLSDNKFLFKDKLRQRYAMTNKFTAVVQEFFDSHDTKAILVELVEQELNEISSARE